MPSQTSPQNARKPAPRAFGWAKCRNCIKPFEKKRKWQVFCCSKCRNTCRNDDVRLTKIKEKEIKNVPNA